MKKLGILEVTAQKELMTVRVPTEDLFRFMEIFGKVFCAYSADLGKLIIRPVQSYEEDLTGGSSSLVTVAIDREELVDFQVFIEKLNLDTGDAAVKEIFLHRIKPFDLSKAQIESFMSSK